MTGKTKWLVLIAFICVASVLVSVLPAWHNAYAENSDSDIASSCPYADGENILNDSSFEQSGTSAFTDPREIAQTWKSVSFAGTDRNGWGYESNNNVFVIYSEPNLLAGEEPVIYQDVAVEKNTYYVVSLYAHTFGYIDQQPDLKVGYRSPTGNDVWLNLQTHPISGIGANWEEYYTVIYTQNYSMIRLTVGTDSIWVGGTLGGYHLDHVQMHKVKTPEEVDFTIPDDFKIGENIDPSIQVRFQGETNFFPVQTNAYIRTDYRVVDGDNNVTFNQDNCLVANGEGSTTIELSLDIFGKTLVAPAQNLVADERNRNDSNYIRNVTVRPLSEINFQKFVEIGTSVEMADGSFAETDEFSVTYASTDPRVVSVREINGVVNAIAVGSGNAEITATVRQGSSVGIGSFSVSLQSDNYLIDPGFEVQSTMHFWASEGTAGTGVDDGTTNGYMHSGIANFWLMAPVWWDGTVQPGSTARISQIVPLQQGKYALSAHINRYNATGVDGMLSGQGGIVTIGAVRLDQNLNETDQRFSKEFDTSYGTGWQYEKISFVFDILEEGNYLIYFSVAGDEKLGLGMQLDDMSLTNAEYPVKITAGINTESISVDDLAKIDVFAQYEDGTTEKITSNIRAIFQDYHIACESGGFVIGKSAGTTTVTVKTVILDREYETTFEITVTGGAAQPQTTDKVVTVVAISVSAVLVAAGVALTVVLLRRKKNGRA